MSSMTFGSYTSIWRAKQNSKWTLIQTQNASKTNLKFQYNMTSEQCWWNKYGIEGNLTNKIYVPECWKGPRRRSWSRSLRWSRRAPRAPPTGTSDAGTPRPPPLRHRHRRGSWRERQVRNWLRFCQRSSMSRPISRLSTLYCDERRFDNSKESIDQPTY